MQNIIEYINRNNDRYIEDLKDFLSIPSVSTKPENKSDMERCAKWLSDILEKIGMQNVKIFPTVGHPVVYADWLHADGKPTILIYGHYDVQPPEPMDLWESDPFTGTVRDGKIFGRGTTDDKGQIMIHIKSLEAYFTMNSSLPLNVKMILEGEEEIGSPHLEDFIKSHRDLLKADLVVISDTSMFAKGVPSVCYGLRGLSYMQIDLVGPKNDLHSGSYGGSLHNPIQALAEIIAKLHDKDGKVTIPGFYKDVRKLTKEERAAFKKLPWSDKKYAQSLNLRTLYGEKGYTTLERLWARPTLECNGIWGGFTGEGAKTVLPANASAKISMRLVPNQHPDKVATLFEKYIKSIAPKSVRVSVRNLHGGEPAITPIDSPGVKAAVESLRKGYGKKPLYQREGGSIPIVVQFKKILGLDTVLLGFGLPDENAHAPNEFLTLENFFGGIRTVAYFYNELPEYMK